MTTFQPDDAGQPTPKREGAGGRAVVLVIVLLLVLLAAGYYAGYRVAGDRVPEGTEVSGVDVGGLSRAAAVEELESAFADRAQQEIEVSVHEGEDRRTATLRPEQIGLGIDAEASVEAAGAERSWSPARLWDYFTGGDEVDAVVDIDEDRLEAELAELTEGLGTPPKDGKVTFTATGVRTTDPVPGEAVDLATARESVVEAYLGADDSVALEVTPAEPDIDQSDVREAVESFANPAMSAPVTLVFGKSEVRLAPRDYAKALAMVPEDGELVPEVDQKAVTRLVKGATSAKAPVDATVRLVNGRPRVVPAKPGVEFEPERVTKVFTRLLDAPEAKRGGKVGATVREADFTTEEARALKIKEKVSEFTTYYPHAEYRNINIGRAAELISGTVLKPGDVFSLNETVGERTAENGFTEGYIISDGILQKDLGGGVSQMATTTFNAAFFAGLKDIEHKPHSFYIDRYPVGREATVAWPTVDLRFQNDTPYGILINAWVVPSTYARQGQVTVQMWSTKYWDIEADVSERYDYVAPQTRTLTTPDCEPNTGWSGFSVDVTRIFRRHGEEEIHHTEKFHTDYTPADTVVCEEPRTDPPAED